MICGVGTVNWSCRESFTFWSFANKLVHFQVLIFKSLYTTRNSWNAPPTKFLVTDTNQRTPEVGLLLPLKQPAMKIRRGPARNYSWFYSPTQTINVLFLNLTEILSPSIFLHFYCYFSLFFSLILRDFFFLFNIYLFGCAGS